MCTVTLSYDQNNALARHKLAALLATGLFVKTSVSEPATTPVDFEESEEAHRKDVEAFLYASKVNMSHVIARYL